MSAATLKPTLLPADNRSDAYSEESRQQPDEERDLGPVEYQREDVVADEVRPEDVPVSRRIHPRGQGGPRTTPVRRSASRAPSSAINGTLATAKTRETTRS